MNKQSRKIKNLTKRSMKIKNLTKRSIKIKNLSKRARQIKKKSKLYGGVRLDLNINTKEECNNYRNKFKSHKVYWDTEEKKCIREKKSDEQN